MPPAGTRLARTSGCPSPTPPANRDDHLLPVGDRGRQVDEVERGPRPGAAGLGDRVVDPTTLREPVEPRLQDRAGDVDDELPRRRLLHVEGDRLPARRRLGLASAEGDPAGERERDQQDDGVGERPRP